MTRRALELIQGCADNISLTVSELVAISKTAPKRYYVWTIDKRSGAGKRIVCHPARELKLIQYYFLHKILVDLPIHPAATAYVAGGSIAKNAKAHAGSRVIMKLDFADFFNSLTVADWRKYAGEVFPHWSNDEMEFSCRILFWGAGGYFPRCLAIGAPTSPLISNALMYEVDVKLDEYAQNANLKYTRYADDVTFSSANWLDFDATIHRVKCELQNAKFTNVSINNEKTILVSNKSARRVTGLLITPENTISLGRERKRLISAMVHHAACRKLSIEDWPKLAGLLAFAADAEPNFVDRLERKYSKDLVRQIMRSQTYEGLD